MERKNSFPSWEGNFTQGYNFIYSHFFYELFSTPGQLLWGIKKANGKILVATKG